MAAPVDAGRIGTTGGSTAATNKACDLPASIAAGDVLILMLRSNGADSHTTPGGWNDLVKNNAADGSDDVTSIFYRFADGSEGTSVTVTCTNSVKFSSIAHRVTGGHTSQAPDISTIATGASVNPGPTAVTITGGPKDVLVLAYGGWEGEQTSPPATIPANYSNSVGSSSGASGAVATNSRCAGASRQLTAVSSEDPGTWTISVSDDWSSWAIAIQEAPPAFTPLFNKFRFYHDGTESGSVPWDAESTNVTVEVGVGEGDQKIHLRVLIQETGGGSGLTTDDYQLQVSLNGGGYTNVTGASSAVHADSGSSLTDGGATTNRATNGITDGTGSFVAGEQEEVNGLIEDTQLTGSNFTEHVWALLLVAADLAAGNTLDFRIALNGGSPGMSNVVTPRITITKRGPYPNIGVNDLGRVFTAPRVGAMAIPPVIGLGTRPPPSMRVGPLSGGLARLNRQYRRALFRELPVEVTPVEQSVVSPWEAMLIASQTVATPWESIISLLVTVATPWTAVQGVEQTKASPWESILSATQSVLTPWEAAITLEPTVVTPWESGGTAIQTVATPWESAGALQQTQATPWEALGAVVQTAATQWTALGYLAATLGEQWEATGLMSQTVATPWESGGTATQTVATPWESILTVTPATVATPWESILSAQQTVVTPWTAVQGIEQSKAVPWESGGTAIQTTATPWESLISLLVSVLTPWEAILTVTPKTVATPWEALLLASQTQTAPWESGGTATQTLATPWEALVTAQPAVLTPWEALVGLQPVVVTPWEAVGLHAQTTATPWESGGTAIQTVAIPWESIAIFPVEQSVASPWESILTVTPATVVTPWESILSASQTRITPWESGGTAIQSLVTPWEAAGLLIVTVATPWESILTVTPKTVTTPWESILSAAQTLAAPYEALGLLTKEQAVPWEAIVTIYFLDVAVAIPWEAVHLAQKSVITPWETGGSFVVVRRFINFAIKAPHLANVEMRGPHLADVKMKIVKLVDVDIL